MNKTTTKPALKDIKPETIAEWKTEHGNVYLFTSDDKKVKGYFKTPDRKLMDAYTIMQKDHPVKANEVLAKDCFLGGDDELINDDAYFYGLSKQLSKLLQVKEGELTEI